MAQAVDSQRIAHAIRFLAMDACERVGEGEGDPGTPLGAAEIATALFTRHRKFDAADPTWFDRDRFVLSAGHGSMLLYALLHLTGYEGFPIEALKTFRELGSTCEGHPERHVERGVEVTTGPLGQASRMPPAWRWRRPTSRRGSARGSWIIAATPSSAMAACRRASPRKSRRSPGISALASAARAGPMDRGGGPLRRHVRLRSLGAEDDLWRHFGLTPEAVAEAVHRAVQDAVASRQGQ